MTLSKQSCFVFFVAYTWIVEQWSVDSLFLFDVLSDINALGYDKSFKFLRSRCSDAHE